MIYERTLATRIQRDTPPAPAAPPQLAQLAETVVSSLDVVTRTLTSRIDARALRVTVGNGERTYLTIEVELR